MFIKINMQKVSSHQSHGADKECLSHLFTSLAGYRLDYASMVYESATKTAMKMRHPVLHLGLRIASGAFRTSPAQSFHVECDQWGFEPQRMFTALTYAVKTS